MCGADREGDPLHAGASSYEATQVVAGPARAQGTAGGADVSGDFYERECVQLRGPALQRVGGPCRNGAGACYGLRTKP